MGLSEKAKYVLQSDLEALLSEGGELSVERLRGLMLSLDRYRRELMLANRRHENDERRLATELKEARARQALWEERLALARSRGREDLIGPAEERLEQAVTLARDAADRHGLLERATTNLKVSLDRVERTLKMLRRKKKRLLELAANPAPPGQETQRTIAAASLLADILGPTEPGACEDPLEEAFRSLEHEDLTRRLDSRE